MKILFGVIGILLLVAIAESKSVQYINIVSRGGKLAQCALQHGGINEEHDLEVKDIFDINKELDYQDGDMVFPKGRSTLVNPARHWESHEIAVSYSPDLHLEAIASVDLARQEYELRTCLKLVDRTDETDYIYFEPLSGCYSSVGFVGGGQTISIGNGCERIGTVVHEIMHAIGIYHEQSRTDRDNYVTIEFDNIDSGKENNFNTYTYAKIDDHRVPYDYNSVMHYSDTSFSNNGNPTIVTSDPMFQDVIGQRTAFSPGDIDKINRMYGCADTVRVSYSCSFEDETICGYYHDSADWTIHDVDSVNPPSYLPLTDGSFGEEGKGSYMLFDGTGKSSSTSGTLYSMKYISKVATQCLEFSYHMKVDPSSSASLKVHVASIDQLTGDIVDMGEPVTTLTGNHDYNWNIERLSISAPDGYVLAFVANTGSGYNDVIAVDDVTVVDKACETNYFVIHDYEELVTKSVPGHYIYSPVMYTDDGYAFQIKVYPVGSTSSKEGYMAMFYYVAKGENDDELAWPFADRFIRMAVVDQDPDAVARMSQSNNFVSDSTSGAWQKPTEEGNSGYGYSSFMTTSDVMNTRNFVKNNALVISVQVTDMSSRAAARYNHASVRSGGAINGTEIEPQHPPAEDESVTIPVSEGVLIIAISSASMLFAMVVIALILNEMNSREILRLSNSGGFKKI